VRSATILLNSMCVVVPVLIIPTSGYGVFLCIPKEGAKINFICFKIQYKIKYHNKR
jgi:hypothetical protein